MMKVFNCRALSFKIKKYKKIFLSKKVNIKIGNKIAKRRADEIVRLGGRKKNEKSKINLL